MAKRNRQWLDARRRDVYVKQARGADYRARAVYKLLEIDQRQRLLHPGQFVFDLGASPGSWSQYASKRVGRGGKVVAVDRLPISPIRGVDIIQGDFSEMEIFNRCLASADGRGADLVMSDMAPNLSGIREADQARSMHLAELAYDFAGRTLNAGGDLLLKLFQGEGADEFRKELMERFQRVIVVKPKASRDGSREFYVLARGYVV